ncbi:MAG: helix-turn-helix domain-containing protein [Pseudomonadota bacterium]|nr:helix-turn-helix domain-containing protein [Pseudomonadota bacterium]
MATRTARRITRGELARLTGVNSETIRYLERIGILAAPERTEGGHRVYDEGHVRTLGFVRRARSLGFTPKEVQAILDLGGPGRAYCAEVRDIAAQHLEQVRAKMADLAQIERLLASTIEHCSGKAVPECAVIEMLEDVPPRDDGSSG